MSEMKIAKYLRKHLKKESEYMALVKVIEHAFIIGAYKNLYAKEEVTRVTAKQVCWITANINLKNLFSTIRGLIPSYLNIDGTPNVTGA